MKKTILIFFWMLLMEDSFSQQQSCNDDNISNTKGAWTKRSDANVFPDSSFPKNQFPQANIRIDKMQKLLQAAYPEPKGFPDAKVQPAVATYNAQLKEFVLPYEAVRSAAAPDIALLDFALSGFEAPTDQRMFYRFTLGHLQANHDGI